MTVRAMTVRLKKELAKKSTTPATTTTTTTTTAMTPRTNKTSNRSRNHQGGGRLTRFLLRGTAAVAFLHYLSLLFIFHQGMLIGDQQQGKDQNNMILPFMDLPMVPREVVHAPQQPQQKEQVVVQEKTNTAAIPTLTLPSKPLRVLWAIESTATEDGRQRRQLLRETYLSYKKDPSSSSSFSSSSSPSPSNLFCSLQELEQQQQHQKQGNPSLASPENNGSSCQFFYSFIIPESSSSSSSTTATKEKEQEEPDTLKWDDSGKGLSSWLESIQRQSQQSEPFAWNFIAWVDPRTLIAPLEILDLLQEELQQLPQQRPLFIETPENKIPFRCGDKCAWDHENQLRDGRMMIASMPLVSLLDLQANPCLRKSGQDTMKVLRSCLANISLGKPPGGDGSSSSQRKVVAYDTIGHQYAQIDDWQYRILWERQEQMAQFYRRFQRKHKVHIISARFNRDPDRYTSEFQDIKTAMIHYGFDPASQIFLYDGVFPDFIRNDHRWEQHLEFLDDPEVNDLGAGYWFWKAPILEHHMNHLLDDGDFVIFNNLQVPFQLPWINELLETMMSRQANLAAFHVFFPENQYSKRDLYESLCSQIPDRFLPNDISNQYTGHFLILRKSPGTMDFLQRFTRIAANYHMLSDEKGVLPEDPEFKEHRRDQSIISLLLKCQYHESGKQDFPQPALKELGWFGASTFHLEPIIDAVS